MGQGADLARHRARDGGVEGEPLPDGRQAAELRRQRAGEGGGGGEDRGTGGAKWTECRLRVASQGRDAIRTMVDNGVGSLVVQVSYSA